MVTWQKQHRSFNIHFQFLWRLNKLIIIIEMYITFMSQANIELKLPLVDVHLPEISLSIGRFNTAIFRGYFKPLGA